MQIFPNRSSFNKWYRFTRLEKNHEYQNRPQNVREFFFVWEKFVVWFMYVRNMYKFENLLTNFDMKRIHSYSQRI